MSAILVENDAQGWYESGPVCDMLIRRNRFINCREPVIHINPRNSTANNSVHRNIRVIDNHFVLRDRNWISAKSTAGLLIEGNTIYSDNTKADPDGINTEDCADVSVRGNRHLPLSEWSKQES